jgi:hypothetical protein
MNNQYYQLSTDYDLAEKHLKEGATLAAWLWKPNKQLNTFSITDGELFINGSYPPSDFTYEKYLVQFLLPIPDPTYELKTDLTEVQQQCSKLQHSLTQALNEADELRGEVIVANASIAELEAQNTLANEALTAIAKQLGFESLTSDEVMIAIEELQSRLSQEDLETSRASITSLLKSLNSKISELQDNLNRSQSDRLSELTNIMRMIQALSDTPQDCYYGALRLIRQVVCNAICKLDPSQSWE